MKRISRAGYRQRLERERPGSIDDRLMRQQHQRRVDEFYATQRIRAELDTRRSIRQYALDREWIRKAS